MMHDQLLIITQQETPGEIIICARGEVDMITTPRLKNALFTAIEQSTSQDISVDLTQVTFIDSTGLAMLVEANKRLAGQTKTLCLLLLPDTQPDRVLKLGRFHVLMPLAYPGNSTVSPED